MLVREGLRQPLPLYFYRRVPGPWGGEGGPWGGRKERKKEGEEEVRRMKCREKLEKSGGEVGGGLLSH